MRYSLLSLFLLIGCGQRDALEADLLQKSAQDQQNQAIEDPQQNPYDLDDRLIMVASFKSPETPEQDHHHFDSIYETPEKYHLELPQVIQASGAPGTDQKLYILFNDEIDCMWVSHADEDYKDPVCFENAERDPSTSRGFLEGQELELTSIEAVEKIEMHINSAEGDNVLTTASAILIKL